MAWLDLVRWLHVLGACVLIGTGAGIAFFMVMEHRTGNAANIAHTASVVVVADKLLVGKLAACFVASFLRVGGIYAGHVRVAFAVVVVQNDCVDHGCLVFGYLRRYSFVAQCMSRLSPVSYACAIASARA